MFRVEMLPAGRGDALWIEYGDPSAPNGILVDAGTPPTYEAVKKRILAHVQASGTFELFIVTHIDTDHIGGALGLVADGTPGLEPGEIWVNAWRHLQAGTGSDRLGPVDGEILSALLDRASWRWNETFSGGAALITDEGPLPACRLPGGMTLTLLSPGREQLRNLRRNWSRVVRAAGLDPAQPRESDAALKALAARRGIRPDRLGSQMDVRKLAGSASLPDRSTANGSTIAVLAEYDGRSALLAGDGFAGVIAASVRRLAEARGRRRLAVDAFKLPHHGSRGNVSSDLLSLVSCHKFLFSTNGANFGHPDPEAVARVLVHAGRDPVLYFNYRSTANAVWADRALMREFGYRAVYPAGDGFGLTVEL